MGDLKRIVGVACLLSIIFGVSFAAALGTKFDIIVWSTPSLPVLAEIPPYEISVDEPREEYVFHRAQAISAMNATIKK